MRISGLEKLTLTDYPGHIACILFTQGCNFKCPFCQNSPLLEYKEGIIPEEDVFEYLNKRKKQLEGVVVSGGEPTIQKDLVSFITRVKELGLKVKLDTNGSNPMVLQELLDKNLLDYVAMDIKNVLSKYNPIIGCKTNIKNIEKSINILKNSKIDFEFRTTIMKEHHSIEDIKKICELVDGHKYFLQNYQESENVIDKTLTSFTNDELINIKKELINFPNVNIRGI